MLLNTMSTVFLITLKRKLWVFVNKSLLVSIFKRYLLGLIILMLKIFLYVIDNVIH